MLLTIRNISKAYGAATVLDAISFIINPADRIGIVGSNGVGKSTLLRLLVGQEEADSGTITYAPFTQYGYLPQVVPVFYGRTIQDLILESVGNLRQIEDRMRDLEGAMECADAEQIPDLLEEYATLSMHFQNNGGYDIEHRINAILAGLHISYLPRTREVETLSGGEKTRLGLATLLLRSPDLLLLDEPTNHLDFASIAWLESYLSTYQGAVLITSHDRQFLNRAVTCIYEINEYSHRLTCYSGSYDAYITAKAAEQKQWAEDYTQQQEKLAELHKYVRVVGKTEHAHRALNRRDKYARFGSFQNAQHATASNIRAAQIQLERIEANLIPPPPEILPITSRFSTELMRAKAILFTLSHVTKYIGKRCLFQNVNLTVSTDTRIMLIGPNGAGKTTLLKLMLGLDTPTDGEMQITDHLRSGYLSQEPAFLDLRKTVIETYREGHAGYESDLIAQLLSYGLFQEEDLTKQVGQLSIGQQRKLEIARLMAANPNILFLDEPTNYISLDVLEAFESAIINFSGPVIVTSHDRWFIQRFKGEVWEITVGGRVVKHHHSSDAYFSTIWRDIS